MCGLKRDRMLSGIPGWFLPGLRLCSCAFVQHLVRVGLRASLSLVLVCFVLVVLLCSGWCELVFVLVSR